MEDFFERYKKKRILTHLWVFWLAFMLALWVHITLLWGNTGQYITASILDATAPQEAPKLADIYTEISENNLSIFNSQALNNLTSISFTIAYNPELGKLSTEKLAWLDADLQVIDQQPWLLYIQLTTDESINLATESTLIKLSYEALSEGRQFFNIVQASFTDTSGELFLLTSSWTWL